MTQIQEVYSGSGTPHTLIASTSSEAWAEELELVTQRDRDFFLRNPTEESYIRSITSVEILEAKAMDRSLSGDGCMLVGEVAPGCRIRLYFNKNETPPLPQFREMKKQFRHEFGKKANRTAEQFKSANRTRPKAKGFG